MRGRICWWLLLFQEYDIEVIINPEKTNMGTYNMSHIESSEQGGSLDDNLLDAYLFRVTKIDEKLEDITYLLIIGETPQDNTIAKKRQLVVKEIDYHLIASQIYKLGADEILRRCLLPHKREDIMRETYKELQEDTM